MAPVYKHGRDLMRAEYGSAENMAKVAMRIHYEDHAHPRYLGTPDFLFEVPANPTPISHFISEGNGAPKSWTRLRGPQQAFSSFCRSRLKFVSCLSAASVLFNISAAFGSVGVTRL